jgi:hypothetical protein
VIALLINALTDSTGRERRCKAVAGR